MKPKVVGYIFGGIVILIAVVVIWKLFFFMNRHFKQDDNNAPPPDATNVNYAPLVASPPLAVHARPVSVLTTPPCLRRLDGAVVLSNSVPCFVLGTTSDLSPLSA